MKMFKVIACLLLCSSIAACSSTKKTSGLDEMDNNYYTNNFGHTTFTINDKNSVKKELGSDHQLMMSLLNRPATQDQAMMLTLAQNRANYSSSLYAQGISIKGARSNDDNYRNEHQYANLIEQDDHAVLISAPQ